MDFTNNVQTLILANANAIALHPRKCSITGEGMDAGFFIEHNDLYIKNESDLINVLRSDYEGIDKFTDAEAIEISYETGYHYYTEWSIEDAIEDEGFFVELTNGTLISYDDFLAKYLLPELEK